MPERKPHHAREKVQHQPEQGEGQGDRKKQQLDEDHMDTLLIVMPAEAGMTRVEN